MTPRVMVGRYRRLEENMFPPLSSHDRLKKEAVFYPETLVQIHEKKLRFNAEYRITGALQLIPWLSRHFAAGVASKRQFLNINSKLKERLERLKKEDTASGPTCPLSSGGGAWQKQRRVEVSPVAALNSLEP
jgi:hypothetical protein